MPSVIRRLMVDPKFQRKGIAAKLLRFVVAEADQERRPIWLFSRPAAVALYTRAGFVQVGETELDVPEFKVRAAETGMLCL
jgi:GNAT superfamily N-acetyltransferase